MKLMLEIQDGNVIVTSDENAPVSDALLMLEFGKMYLLAIARGNIHELASPETPDEDEPMDLTVNPDRKL